MDWPISSAARLLAAGDPLGALKPIVLRNDPPALGLRGSALAQLGDYERARQLLRRAGRGFTPGERLAKARCLVIANTHSALGYCSWVAANQSLAARGAAAKRQQAPS